MFKSRLIVNCFHRNNLIKSFSSATSKTKICIIGSGPAGFYTAQRLMKGVVEVDIFEKLPAPYGLIRYGVAPDHTKIRIVIPTFNKIAEQEDCNFYGNVNVGKDITVDELLKAYHAVVFTYGVYTDKKLNIPGENSKNVISSSEIISWYNGHPDYVNLDLNLDCESAIVVGQGNVAMDVARILLQDIDVLSKTDIAEHALETLKKSRIKKVYMVGRRGPLDVAFSLTEFRGLTKLSHCDIEMNSDDFAGIPELIPSLKKAHKKVTQLLHDMAVREHSKNVFKSVNIKFYRTPKAILPDSQGRVEKMEFGINKLKELDISKPSEVFDTGKEEILNSGLVIKCVGYKIAQIDPSIPVDSEYSIISNDEGRVINRKRMYCSGWTRTGPQGVVGSTSESSISTAENILKDIKNGELSSNLQMDRNDILNLLQKRGVKFITFENWKKIKAVEEERGKAEGKPRKKICSVEEMLKVVNLA